MNRLTAILLVCLVIGGCAANDYNLRSRIDRLEKRITILESNQATIADASVVNSEAIKTNAQSITTATHILKSLMDMLDKERGIK
jgi:hypothetical protein